MKFKCLETVIYSLQIFVFVCLCDSDRLLSCGQHHKCLKTTCSSLQSQDGAARVSPESQDLVLELLAQSELKLQSLQKELQGKDLAAVLKEMEEEEVR